MEFLCFRRIGIFLMFSLLVHLCVSRREQPGSHVMLNSCQELPGTRHHLNLDPYGATEHNPDLKRLTFFEIQEIKIKASQNTRINENVDHL